MTMLPPKNNANDGFYILKSCTGSIIQPPVTINISPTTISTTSSNINTTSNSPYISQQFMISSTLNGLNLGIDSSSPSVLFQTCNNTGNQYWTFQQEHIGSNLTWAIHPNDKKMYLGYYFNDGYFNLQSVALPFYWGIMKNSDGSAIGFISEVDNFVIMFNDYANYVNQPLIFAPNTIYNNTSSYMSFYLKTDCSDTSNSQMANFVNSAVLPPISNLPYNFSAAFIQTGVTFYIKTISPTLGVIDLKNSDPTLGLGTLNKCNKSNYQQ
ncbi:unnamed protein product, partial [Rotaria magnacalcarata]